MTKEQILAMEVGDELRRKVGEDIFGFIVELRKGFRSFEGGTFIEDPIDRVNAVHVLCYITDRWNDKSGKEVLVWEELPDYPNDISAAWQVIELMLNRGYQPIVNWLGQGHPDGKGWHCSFHPHNHIFGRTEAPEAISKAALLTTLKE